MTIKKILIVTFSLLVGIFALAMAFFVVTSPRDAGLQAVLFVEGVILFVIAVRVIFGWNTKPL